MFVKPFRLLLLAVPLVALGACAEPAAVQPGTVTETVTESPLPETVTVPPSTVTVVETVTESAPAAPAVVEPKSEGAYYKNCSAARAAGVTPLRVGDPGYAGHLDRDGDGVACE